MIGLGEQFEGLYRLNLDFFASSLNKTLSVNTIVVNNLTTIPSSALWHFRLGDVSYKILAHMSRLYPSLSFDSNATCDICHFARQKQLPFPLRSSVASNKFELLHFDIWGPLVVPSIHNHKYFLTILDDYCRFVWIVLLKSKSEVSQHVKNFIALVKISFISLPKPSEVIMVLNFYSLPSMLQKVFHIIGLVLKLPNKMGELRESTNIF